MWFNMIATSGVIVGRFKAAAVRRPGEGPRAARAGGTLAPADWLFENYEVLFHNYHVPFVDRALTRSTFLGPIFEGFLASEIIKRQINAGRRKEIYYFRDQQGLEVDFVVPTAARALMLIEAKASRTITPAMAESLVRLGKAVSRYAVTSLVVHFDTPGEPTLAAIRPGVRAVPVDRFLSTFAPSRQRLKV